MTLGERLQQLRKDRDLSQKEIAAHLKFTVSTISNYEQDVHAPDLETLRKLADYYDVSADYLLGRTQYCYSLETLHSKLTPQYSTMHLINTVSNLTEKNMISLLDYLDLLVRREKKSLKTKQEYFRRQEKELAMERKMARIGKQEQDTQYQDTQYQDTQHQFFVAEEE